MIVFSLLLWEHVFSNWFTLCSSSKDGGCGLRSRQEDPEIEAVRLAEDRGDEHAVLLRFDWLLLVIRILPLFLCST